MGEPHSNGARAVALLVLRSWRNQLWDALGRSRGALAAAVLVSAASLVMFEFGLSAFLLPLFEGIAQRFGIGIAINSSTSGMTVAATMVVGALLAASPDTTLIDRLMTPMPLTTRSRFLGYQLPTLVLAVAFLLALYAPVLGALVLAQPLGLARAMWLVALVLAHIVYAVLLFELVFLAVRLALTRLLAIPDDVSRTSTLALVGLGTTIWYITVSARVIDTLEPVHSPLSIVDLLFALPDRMATSSLGPVPGAALVGAGVIAVLALLAGATLALSRLLVRTEGMRQRPLFRSFLRPRRPVAALFVTAVRGLARHPENRLFAVFFAGTAVVVAGAAVALTRTVEWAGLAATVLATLPAIFAINAYGRAGASRWSVVVAPVGRVTWLAVTTLATLAYCAAIASALLTPLVALGWRPGAGESASLACTFLVATMWTFTAGTIVPCSEDVPLSGALSALGSLVVAIPVYRLLSALGFPGAMPRSLAVTVAVVWVLWTVVYIVDERRLGGSGS